MAPRVVQTLTDLRVRWGGHIRFECPTCQRVRLYCVIEIAQLFRERRWDDRWKVVNQHFRCAVCLRRPPEPRWIEHAHGQVSDDQFACLAPFGINPRAWALASPADRERLIKAPR